MYSSRYGMMTNGVAVDLNIVFSLVKNWVSSNLDCTCIVNREQSGTNKKDTKFSKQTL